MYIHVYIPDVFRISHPPAVRTSSRPSSLFCLISLLLFLCAFLSLSLFFVFLSALLARSLDSPSLLGVTQRSDHRCEKDTSVLLLLLLTTTYQTGQ